MNHTTEVSHPVLKIISAWAVYLGITSWQEGAAFLAFIYSLLLICEWIYKKVYVGLFVKKNEP